MHIVFTIPLNRQAEAATALKMAVPALKNANKCIADGVFDIDVFLAGVAISAIEPFTTSLSVGVSKPGCVDATLDPEVVAAGARLTKALEGLEKKLNDGTNKIATKAINAAAAFLEGLTKD